MIWIVLAGVLLVIIVVVVFSLKKTKPSIEFEADEVQVDRLGLQPGEFVSLELDKERNEVTICTARPDTERLGAINNSFIFRNVAKGYIEAKIGSIEEGKIVLEIVPVPYLR